MSDIDFDELDRAVTSVLNGSSGKEGTSATQPVAEPAVGLAPDAAIEPEYRPAAVPAATPAPEPEQPVKPVAVSAQALHPVAPRPIQRGRFLDMVHPAHDMAPRANTAERPIGRPAAVAAPITDRTFVSDVVSNEDPATNMTHVEPASVITAEPATGQPAEPAEENREPADFFSGAPAQSPAEPIQSPFIPDAKVEKRPLGAFAATEQNVLPVGEELHEKLVAVESEDNVIETAESPIPMPVTSVAPTTPAVSELEPDKTQPERAVEAKPDRLSLTDHSAKNRLNKPPKYGKGTLIWVVVLIAVLLIGGGVGASLYFFVLQ